MKNLKKIIPLIAALFVLTAICCSCGKKEEVTININVPKLEMSCIAYPECDYSSQFLQAAWEKFADNYDKYDVKLKDGAVHEFEQTEYTQNITDKYDTEDAIDLTFGGYFTLGTYIYEGHVISLDDIITNKIYYEFSGSTWSMSKAYNNNNNNNTVYMLPFYSLQNVLCYNKDLFRSCGLEEYVSQKDEIQGWSLDEWEYIFSTLKTNLPEGSYPMMMYAKNNQGDTHTMIQLRCKGSEFFDEKADFYLNTPSGIAGLQWIKDNYDKGYYPEGCENMEILDCQKLFTDGKLGLYVYNSALAESYEKAGVEIGYVNFPGEDAHGVNSNWVTGFMAFDNGDTKKIEVVKDFLTYIYNSDELMDYSTGGLPCSRNVVERWHDDLPLEYAFTDNEEYSVDFTRNNPNWGKVREAFWPHIQALLAGKETAEEAAKGIDTDCNKAINESERILHE